MQIIYTSINNGGEKCPDILISRGNWAGFVQGIQWYANINAQIDTPLQDKMTHLIQMKIIQLNLAWN